MEFFKDLVTNGSGVSSKSFFLVVITIVGTLLLCIVGFILLWEVIKTGTIHTDLKGLATLVGSITALFGAAGLTKCIGERNENRSC